jgi:hypothetical protein
MRALCLPGHGKLWPDALDLAIRLIVPFRLLPCKSVRAVANVAAVFPLLQGVIHVGS